MNDEKTIKLNNIKNFVYQHVTKRCYRNVKNLSVIRLLSSTMTYFCCTVHFCFYHTQALKITSTLLNIFLYSISMNKINNRILHAIAGDVSEYK